METVPVPPGNGVDDEVRVVVTGIQVRSHDHLKVLPPKLLRETDTDLVGLFRRDLSGSERLVAVKADPAACQVLASAPAPVLLRLHELPGSDFFPAVQTSHVAALLRFEIVRCVLDHVIDHVERCLLRGSFLCGLFRIAGVVDDLIDTALDGPDRCYRHDAP